VRCRCLRVLQMLNFLRKFASLKIALLGMALLAIGAMLSYGNPLGTPVWVLVAPMALLAVNLVAAITTNPRINQQPGLLVFHVALLLLLLLATVGRLTHLDAHLELVVGTGFEADKLLEINAGPLHPGSFDSVHFVQGPYTVEYSPGMQRGLTHSHVKVKTAAGAWEGRIVGDDRPLVMDGYRFYTTFNKGFTSVLTWLPAGGAPVTGSVNMPSYPLFEYKQDNRWTPHGSNTEIKFWLQLKTAMNAEAHWVLDAASSSGVLIVTSGDKRYEVRLGEFVDLPQGRLRFEALTMWMGYRLFYDPTIQWLFFVAIMGILGLTHYFWKKINLQPWMDEKPDTIAEQAGKPLDGIGSPSSGKPSGNNAPVTTAYLTGEKH